MTATNQTPTPAKPSVKEEKIDRQVEDSFPASDPPSYSGGNHIVGAPVERESEAVTADNPDVKNAQKRVKDGSAGKPGAY